MTTELASTRPAPSGIVRPRSGSASAGRTLTVTVLSNCELVRDGVARMLENYDASFDVHLPGIDTGDFGPVDVLLVDSDSDGADLPSMAELSLTYGARHVVVHSWDSAPHAVEASLRRGASGYLDKRLDASALADALRRVGDGEQVVLVCDQQVTAPDVAALAELHHLSVREGEILRLISQGLSNQEIAERAYLSINTVKSYIRSAYRRMGVESRSRAILWAIDRGFGNAPDPQPEATAVPAQRT